MLRLAAAVILGAQMSAALAQSAGSIDRPGAGGAVTNHNGAVNHSTGTMARVNGTSTVPPSPAISRMSPAP